ncbi:multicopper oxidase domain-containing protein [Agromyces sp. M3QZ16-3]|uniref:multicopper oxidase domain-containing protein n=1 Tax=Agromyces sp. M3QZ16-3 TaxID=3447585 RepID=UPI003F693D57
MNFRSARPSRPERRRRRVRRPRALAVTAASLIAAAGIAVAFAGCGLVDPTPVSTEGRIGSDTPLPVPPLAESTVAADATCVFSLEARAGATDAFDPYMYHCHLLQHEHQGMMGQFVVVEPGRRATMTEETNDHDHAH